ncbi:hypothetical protein SLEP1_g58066 [Rubroshorea leprosula]|uniref:PGG domain-containing protein n=1 Tax=Rubroshorea leprosula TaxID=152421 RepID=A0AAV5MQI7_9ROSI|nr:hypothetical protein SLEP1_g58066 [Rubroshorea leprosula]
MQSVEAFASWPYKEQKNNTGETPFQVFAREHKDLLKEAEEWMKKTAESSTVVGALIITIMFAAAFTVPGGNDQNTGFPIFLNSTEESSPLVPYTVFMVSDAISLFTAAGSVLMFLGILTSRYAYQDFRISLPLKLIVGLCSLFVSIATMAVAFCASLFIMLKGRLVFFILITVLAGIACVILFMLVQFQLVFEIYSSTCRSHIFGASFASILGKYVKSRLFISRLFIRRPRDN